jgi:hypothetical protein
LADAVAGMFPDPHSRPARGLRAMVLLDAGAHAEAAEVSASLQEGSAAAGAQWLMEAAYGAELAAGLGSRPAAEYLYRALAPFADQAVVSGAAVTFKGVVAHHLGILAAALGRTAQAAEHLARAVAAHERLAALPWALRSRYELARVRLDLPDGRPAAVAALAEAARQAHRIGMTGLAGAAEAAAFSAGREPVVAGIFARDGAWWTLGYGGVSVRLRDAKGLADLAALLGAPGRPVLAADLVAAGAGALARADLGLGADEVFDETARRQIRGRLADLDEEVAEAETWADPERAARARDERDVLLAELAAAAGLGGRARRLGDQSERARKAVTARVRDAIRRIEREHPALGAHLRASVTTGTHCAYSPPTPVSWRL